MKITTKAFDKTRDVYDGIEPRLRKYIPRKYAQYIVVSEYWGGDYDAVVCQGARMSEFTEQFFRFHKNDLIALKRWYEIMHYDEKEELKRDIDFFEFGKILTDTNLDVYYFSTN